MDLFLSDAELKRMKKSITDRRRSKSSSSSHPIPKQAGRPISLDRSSTRRPDLPTRHKLKLPTAVHAEEEEEKEASHIAATAAEEVPSSYIAFAPREPRRNSTVLMPPPLPPRRPVAAMPTSSVVSSSSDAIDVMEKVARKREEDLESYFDNILADPHLSNDDICLMLGRAIQITEKYLPVSTQNGVNLSTATTVQVGNASSAVDGFSKLGSLNSSNSQPSHFLLKDWQLLKSDDGRPGLRLSGTLCSANNKVIANKFVTEAITDYNVHTNLVSTEDGDSKFIPLGRCTNYHSLPSIVRNYFTKGFSDKWQKAARAWNSLMP